MLRIIILLKNPTEPIFAEAKEFFLAIFPGKLALYNLLCTVRDETMLISAEMALEEMNGSFFILVIMRLSVVGEVFFGLPRCSTEVCSCLAFCTKYKA